MGFGGGTGFDGGMLEVGMPADFFTVDLNDLSIAGSDANDLLPLIVFGMAKSAIADVVVGGRMVVRDREHDEQDAIVSEYTRTRDRVWASA